LTARAAVPSWSRDGKWIYVRSTRSGRDELWRIAAAGGPPEQITRTGGIAAWESWNGELLHYSRSGTLYSQSLTGGPERQVLTCARTEWLACRVGPRAPQPAVEFGGAFPCHW
jgi:Tol biopolymer transport system component